ncbi:hypothetical protein EBU94_07700 [bacterium]|nr:hypothetical protein [bacterium]
MTVNINFKYIDGKSDTNKNRMIEKVCKFVGIYYPLPNLVTIEMRKLGKSIFGETVLNSRIKNLIKLNIELNIKDTIHVLTHELIHLSQITTGQLSISQNSELVWEHRHKVSQHQLQKMKYVDYQQLPWEQDVVKKQQFLLELLLKN